MSVLVRAEAEGVWNLHQRLLTLRKMHHGDTQYTEKNAALERAGGGKKGADFFRVLHTRPAFDAGGHVNHSRTGNSDRVREHLGREAAGQHPRTTPRPIRDQPPVKG